MFPVIIIIYAKLCIEIKSSKVADDPRYILNSFTVI